MMRLEEAIQHYKERVGPTQMVINANPKLQKDFDALRISALLARMVIWTIQSPSFTDLIEKIVACAPFTPAMYRVAWMFNEWVYCWYPDTVEELHAGVDAFIGFLDEYIPKDAQLNQDAENIRKLYPIFQMTKEVEPYGDDFVMRYPFEMVLVALKYLVAPDVALRLDLYFKATAGLDYREPDHTLAVVPIPAFYQRYVQQFRRHSLGLVGDRWKVMGWKPHGFAEEAKKFGLQHLNEKQGGRK